jgi:uncharacterized coiled-coil DUF342 family protein
MAFGRIIDIDEKKMKRQKMLDSMRELVQRHDEINKCIEEGKSIDPKLSKNFVVFPLSGNSR